MKTLTFSDNKRAILRFEAETVEYQPEASGEILIIAGGQITFQDTPPLEEMLAGAHSYVFSVTDGNNELMNGRFTVSFMVLEPDQLVVRLS